MKFRRNGIFIEAVVGAITIILIALLYMIVRYNAGKDLILILLGVSLWLFLGVVICIRGLFYDTVYCDKNGIKITTRKRTSYYTWNELYQIEQIRGKSGIIGWTLISISGEKNQVFPSSLHSKKFFDFIRDNSICDIEI
jgi:hypothetical protein